MSVTLPTAAFRVRTAPFPPTGWTFAILSSDGTSQREQISDPVFTADYDNELFQSDTTYKILASHPDYQSSPKLMRGWFDEQEGFHVLSVEEADDDRTNNSSVLSGVFIGLETAENGQVFVAHLINGKPYLKPLDLNVFFSSLLDAANQAVKAKFCELVASCELLTPVVYSFTGGVHYEASAGTVTLNPTLNLPTADWTLSALGVFSKVLEANEFTFNPAVTSRTLAAYKYNSELNVISPLPDWITFNGGTRTFSASISAPRNGEEFPIRVVLSDETGTAAYDDFMFKVALATNTPEVTKLAYAFQKNNPSGGQGSNLDVYVSANVSLELAISATSDVGNLPKSGYTKMSEGTYQSLYNRYNGGLYGVFPTQTVTLYVRQQGTTSDLLVVTLPKFPNANVPLTAVYPS